MVTFIIIRHGYSVGNKEKRFTGQMDLPLDEIGFLQAESVCEYILKNYKVDSIYSSDLSRAYNTVKPLAGALGIDIITREDLREVDVGLWQGMLITDVEKTFPESFALYKKSPGISRFDGGESYAECMERARNAFAHIAAENDGKTVVVATHGGVVRNLRAAWTGVGAEDVGEILHVPNASVTMVEYEDGEVRFLEIGNNSFLSDRTTEEGIR